MSLVEACYTITQNLLNLLQTEGQDRGRQIEEAEALLEQRGQILPGIQPPFTEEEQKLGRDMHSMNGEIAAHLQKLHDLVKKDLQETKVKKQSAGKYANPYEALQTDGVFYDKRN